MLEGEGVQYSTLRPELQGTSVETRSCLRLLKEEAAKHRQSMLGRAPPPSEKCGDGVSQ